jgi:peptide chain release factor subunit 1
MASASTGTRPVSKAFPSWVVLRELAAQRSESACLSLYVDLDPKTAPTIPDVISHLNSLYDDAHKRASAKELGHSERLALDAALERIHEHFADFDRSQKLGQALFVSADGYFRALDLAGPVTSSVEIGSYFVVAPLVRALTEEREALFVQVGREDGVVYLLKRGRLTELDDRSEEIHGQHDQGGWSQARYQRSIEHDYLDHLDEVAAVIARASRQEPRPVIFLGPEETKGDMLRALETADASLPALVAGWGPAEHHANPESLLKTARPLLEEWSVAEEGRLLDSWQEATGKPDGRGVGGLADVLEAASDGRVELLLYAAPADRRQPDFPLAYECPRCGRVEPQAGVCPLDGDELEEVSSLDGATRETLRYGGRVWACRHDERLTAFANLGALLRF